MGQSVTVQVMTGVSLARVLGTISSAASGETPCTARLVIFHNSADPWSYMTTSAYI